MKNTVMIIISAIIGAVTLAIIISVSGRMNRSMELQSSLSSVVEDTLENMKISENQRYNVSNYGEFISDLTGNLAMGLSADSDIDIKVMKTDIEKGLLSIRIKETFLHPNGREGTVEYERTVILNRLEEEEPAVYKIKFYLTKTDMNSDADKYKEYTIYEGERITVPADPQVAGQTFAGWKDVNDYIADFSLPVEQEQIYYADWR